MIEISRRLDIPDNVIQHPIIQALVDVSIDIVCFTNVRIFPRRGAWSRDPQLIRDLPGLIGYR